MPPPSAHASVGNQAGQAAEQPEEMIPAGNINFQGVEVSQVLEVYAKLVDAPCCAPICPRLRLF